MLAAMVVSGRYKLTDLPEAALCGQNRLDENCPDGLSNFSAEPEHDQMLTEYITRY
jgi:hypothetical protein